MCSECTLRHVIRCIGYCCWLGWHHVYNWSICILLNSNIWDDFLLAEHICWSCKLAISTEKKKRKRDLPSGHCKGMPTVNLGRKLQRESQRTVLVTEPFIVLVIPWMPCSPAPSPIDPVLTDQPDNCYICFLWKTRVNAVLLIIHLSLVHQMRQTLKTKPLIMLLYNWNLLIDKSVKIQIQQPFNRGSG